MGTRSVYMDNANEPHNVIILKHFTEKNRAVVVDIKTRKRKTGSVTFLFLSENRRVFPYSFLWIPKQIVLTRPLCAGLQSLNSILSKSPGFLLVGSTKL